MLSTVMY